MDRASPGPALGIMFLLVVAAFSPAFAQSPTAAAPPEFMTLKERLGAKWTDEQRVDNCKVPLDKRGSRPRPDTCASRPMGLSLKQP
jgi:hypothetical protein